MVPPPPYNTTNNGNWNKAFGPIGGSMLQMKEAGLNAITPNKWVNCDDNKLIDLDESTNSKLVIKELMKTHVCSKLWKTTKMPNTIAKASTEENLGST